MSWFRKVDQRVFGDAKFCELTPQQPSGQGLWIYLLLGPHHVGLPGLFHVGEMGLAEALGWPLGEKGTLFDGKCKVGFRECWAELESRGMVVADWKARVIFLPNTFKQHVNLPRNPNIMKSWAPMLDAVPEHSFKQRWLNSLWRDLPKPEKNPKSFNEAFLKLWPNGSRNDCGNGSGNRSANDSRNSTGTSKGTGTGKSTGNPSEQGQPAPEAQAAASIEKTRVFTDWVRTLHQEADLVGLPPAVCDQYVLEVREGLGIYYESRGGRMTPTRLAHIATRIGKLDFDIQMAAMEVYVDRSSGSKDEKYLCGIASRMARSDDGERVTEMTSHRRREKGRGLFARTQGSAKDGES